MSAPGIAQVRIARPTERLEEMVRFYRDGLGLPVLDGFEGHAGYDGVMIGLPGAQAHLELTSCPGPLARAVPGPEDLLVLYLPDRAERDSVVARLLQMGHPAVPPENPYWIDEAATVVDPDGWRVVLFAGRWDPSPESVPPRWRRTP